MKAYHICGCSSKYRIVFRLWSWRVSFRWRMRCGTIAKNPDQRTSGHAASRWNPSVSGDWLCSYSRTQSCMLLGTMLSPSAFRMLSSLQLDRLLGPWCRHIKDSMTAANSLPNLKASLRSRQLTFRNRNDYLEHDHDNDCNNLDMAFEKTNHFTIHMALHNIERWSVDYLWMLFELQDCVLSMLFAA